MTDMTDQDRADHIRAEAARRIMEDPLVIEALATMERHIYSLWSGQEGIPLDTAHREELHRVQATLTRFVGLFDLYLQNGAQARHILGLPAEEKTFLQRIKEYFHGHKKA